MAKPAKDVMREIKDEIEKVKLDRFSGEIIFTFKVNFSQGGVRNLTITHTRCV